MQSRFRRALDSHASIHTLQDLKLEHNEAGLLNQAIQLNRLDVVSYLLAKDFAISTIGPEIIENFPLMSKFIAACGGQQLQVGLTLAPSVSDAILFRGLWKTENTLSRSVIKNIDATAHFVELAFATKNTDIARQLLSEAKELRDDVSTYTAQYWCLVHNIDGFNHLPQFQQHAVTTMHQLNRTQQFTLLEKLFKLNEPAKQVFLSSQPQVGEEKLTAEHLACYRYAAKAQLERLVETKLTTDDYNKLLQHAYQRKDFVALKTFLEHIELAPTKQSADAILFAIIRMNLEENNVDFAQFLIVATRLDIIDLCVAFRHDQNNLVKLMKLTVSPAGLFEILHKRFRTTPTYAVFELLSQLLKTLNPQQLEKLVKLNWLLSARQLQSSKLSFGNLQYRMDLEKQLSLVSQTIQTFSQAAEEKQNRSCKFLFVGSNATLLVGMITALYFNLSQNSDENTRGLSGAFIGIIAFLALSVAISYLSCRQRQRITLLDYYGKKLNAYSPEIQESANTIFAEFNDFENNPFAEMSLETDVNGFLTALRNQQTEIQKKLNHFIEAKPISVLENVEVVVQGEQVSQAEQAHQAEQADQPVAEKKAEFVVEEGDAAETDEDEAEMDGHQNKHPKRPSADFSTLRFNEFNMGLFAEDPTADSSTPLLLSNKNASDEAKHAARKTSGS